MRRVSFILTVFFTLILNQVNAGDKFSKNKALADQIFEEEEYIEAQEYYEYLDSISPGNPDVSYKLGVIYMYRKKYDLAEHKISYAQKFGYEDSTRLRFHYYYGRLNHLRHKLDKAQEHYLKYKSTLDTNSLTYFDEVKEVEHLYQECEYGKELMEDALELKIRNIGSIINTKYDEYVPLMSADDSMLVFTSKRPNDRNKRDVYTDEYHEDIYISYNSKAGWSTPKEISGEILETYRESPSGDRSQLLNYFIKKRLSILTESIGEF